jgi:glutamate dehydrogenase/leucine dehydrogenase
MDSAFEQVYEVYKNKKVSMRKAADIVAVQKVVDAMKNRKEF